MNKKTGEIQEIQGKNTKEKQKFCELNKLFPLTEKEELEQKVKSLEDRIKWLEDFITPQIEEKRLNDLGIIKATKKKKDKMHSIDCNCNKCWGV